MGGYSSPSPASPRRSVGPARGRLRGPRISPRRAAGPVAEVRAERRRAKHARQGRPARRRRGAAPALRHRPRAARGRRRLPSRSPDAIRHGLDQGHAEPLAEAREHHAVRAPLAVHPHSSVCGTGAEQPTRSPSPRSPMRRRSPCARAPPPPARAGTEPPAPPAALPPRAGGRGPSWRRAARAEQDRDRARRLLGGDGGSQTPMCTTTARAKASGATSGRTAASISRAIKRPNRAERSFSVSKLLRKMS